MNYTDQDFEQLVGQKIYDRLPLVSKIAHWRSQRNKIVFTNGVFDLLHIGHLTYLTKAAMLGNKLIIGLNSDECVRHLKGPERPINNYLSRATLLASLFYVDAVVMFDEPTPANLIKQLMPDVLVKGADYTPDQIAGAGTVLANGGEVKTISFINGYSSTAIINKIKQY